MCNWRDAVNFANCPSMPFKPHRLARRTSHQIHTNKCDRTHLVHIGMFICALSHLLSPPEWSVDIRNGNAIAYRTYHRHKPQLHFVESTGQHSAYVCNAHATRLLASGTGESAMPPSSLCVLSHFAFQSVNYAMPQNLIKYLSWIMIGYKMRTVLAGMWGRVRMTWHNTQYTYRHYRKIWIIAVDVGSLVGPSVGWHMKPLPGIIIRVNK